jgi:hypothetical protein
MDAAALIASVLLGLPGAILAVVELRARWRARRAARITRGTGGNRGLDRHGPALRRFRYPYAAVRITLQRKERARRPNICMAVTGAASYDPPLDEGIRRYVEALGAAGVETFESCQGGPGHAYPEPTVRFYGEHSEGFRALAVALQHRFQVSALRRAWPLVDGEPTGPWWELTFQGPSDPAG